MSYALERETIESYLKANWTETGIAYDNVPGLIDVNGNYVKMSDNPTEFIRIVVRPVKKEVTTLGHTPDTRNTGIIFIQVFTQEGTGSNRALEIADSITSLFQSKLISGIQCLDSNVQNIGPNLGYYQINVLTRYYANYSG